MLSESCRKTARLAIVPARLRRCRSSLIKTCGPGPSTSRRPSRRTKCRRGRPIRNFGKWENDRSLSQKDKDTLLAWVDAGAPEGNVKDAPKPATFTPGWYIGKPDVVIEMPLDIQVQAQGVIEYQYVIVPTGFTEDKWIFEAAEARPGDRALVHHIIAFVREPGSKFLADAKPGIAFVPKRVERARNQTGEGAKPEDQGAPPELLQGYAPGLPPAVLRPGQAKLIKAGSDIVFQMHYTANGTAGVDRSKVGLIFAKEPPKERVITMNATNNKFKIPANDGNYKVDADFTFGDDVKLVDLMPHMHLRGKDFEFRLVLIPMDARQNAARSSEIRLQLAALLLPRGSDQHSQGRLRSNARRTTTTRPPTSSTRIRPRSSPGAIRVGKRWMIDFFDVAVSGRQESHGRLRQAPRGAAPQRQVTGSSSDN